MSRLESRFRARWQKRRTALKGAVLFPSALKMKDLPTKFGWSIFLVLAVMFIWSANHQLNLGYALTFLLFILWLLGWIVVAEQLAGLEVRALGGAPVWAGDDASFNIQVSEKNGRSRGRFVIRNDWHETSSEHLPAGESVTLSLREPTTRRGWHDMHVFTILSTYPAGAFYAWQWFFLQAKVLVYPRPSGDMPLPWQISAGRGKHTGIAVGEDELSGLRPYASGDPLSRVAWKRYGQGELLLKQFSGSGAPQILLDYELIAGDVELRLSQLAKWIVEADEGGFSYALKLPDQYFSFSQGEQHRQECLRALALFGF